jgi:hypothetical protein
LEFSTKIKIDKDHISGRIFASENFIPQSSPGVVVIPVIGYGGSNLEGPSLPDLVPPGRV